MTGPSRTAGGTSGRAGKRILFVIVIGAALLCSAPTAGAEPVGVGDGWLLFGFGPVGSTTEAFTFTSDGPAVVSVTDAFCPGDGFRVRVDGVAVGDISSTADDSCVGEVADPDLAFTDPRFAHGSFPVGPGPHEVVLEVIRTPFGNGVGFIRVDLRTPPSADACRHGGWRNYVDDQGRPFRNQGGCVNWAVHHRP
jgi:hypothetical protein